MFIYNFSSSFQEEKENDLIKTYSFILILKKYKA